MRVHAWGPGPIPRSLRKNRLARVGAADSRTPRRRQDRRSPNLPPRSLPQRCSPAIWPSRPTPQVPAFCSDSDPSPAPTPHGPQLTCCLPVLAPCRPLEGELQAPTGWHSVPSALASVTTEGGWTAGTRAPLLPDSTGTSSCGSLPLTQVPPLLLSLRDRTRPPGSLSAPDASCHLSWPSPGAMSPRGLPG